MTRIGLFGGSFDPIHNGHLAVASAAMAQADLAEILFIPTRISPLKQELPPAPDLDRWTMIVLATLELPQYRAARWEMDREGPSYTVDTLRIARRELGDTAELNWIIGADNLLTLPRWRDVAGILEQASFLVVPRADLHGDALRAVWEAMPLDYRARIRILDMEPVTVSSTQIRACLAAGKPIDTLVPRLTMAYIERYNLFRSAGLFVSKKTGPPAEGL